MSFTRNCTWVRSNILSIVRYCTEHLKMSSAILKASTVKHTHENICFVSFCGSLVQICTYKHPHISPSFSTALHKQTVRASCLPASQDGPPTLQPIPRSGTQKKTAGQLILSPATFICSFGNFWTCMNFREHHGLLGRSISGRMEWGESP